MMKLLPVAALALLSASAVFADAGQQIHFDKPDVSDVLVLTSENFDEKINSAELALVEFYAPWCGHCQKLAPHYESAATTLKKDDIVLAKVDCTVQEEVCGRFGVRGYPTLKVFRNGNHQDYAGERVDNAIVKYMQKQALPAVSELKGEDVKAFSTSERVVVIGFFSGPDSTNYTDLSAVANKLRDDYLFGATFDADAAKRFNVTIPGLILFKKFDEGQNIFTDAFTEEAISSFVTTNAMPLMDDISPENYSKYVHPTAVPLAYLFVSTDIERAEFGPRVEAVAKELKGKMNFVFIDAIKYGAHAENVNLLPDSWPALGIEKFDTKQKFPFDQAKEITTEAIKEFAEKVLDGTAKEKIKSEPIPTENDGPVTILVGETFTNITQDPTKDVFVEFYATWCGHCKKLAPIYENLGKLYKDAEDIVIANIEATKNTHSGVDVTGFPTLKLFKAGTNEVIDYEGNRSLESMTEFLTNNAASSFRPSASEIAKLSEPKPDTPSKEETPSEEHQKPEHEEHDEL